MACPWAHRTLIFRTLKGLEDAISVSVVDHFMGDQRLALQRRARWVPQSTPSISKAYMHEIYALADPSKYTGRVTVPVLWDKQQGTIVSNESSEIIRMFNTRLRRSGRRRR